MSNNTILIATRNKDKYESLKARLERLGLSSWSIKMIENEYDVLPIEEESGSIVNRAKSKVINTLQSIQELGLTVPNIILGIDDGIYVPKYRSWTTSMKNVVLKILNGDHLNIGDNVVIHEAVCLSKYPFAELSTFRSRFSYIYNNKIEPKHLSSNNPLKNVLRYPDETFPISMTSKESIVTHETSNSVMKLAQAILKYSATI